MSYIVILMSFTAIFPSIGYGLLQKLLICEIGIVLKLNVIGEFVVTWIYINYNISLREPNEKNNTKRILACSVDREEKCRAGNRKCCWNIFNQSRPARANHGPRAKLVNTPLPPPVPLDSHADGGTRQRITCKKSTENFTAISVHLCYRTSR
jgi:hypothetical protein